MLGFIEIGVRADPVIADYWYRWLGGDCAF
jgi:hypothetical protein